VARNKGDKDYSKSEKQLFVSLINDYSLFGAKQDNILRNHNIMKNRIFRDTVCYSIITRIASS